jgi:hypothetical protein
VRANAQREITEWNQDTPSRSVAPHTYKVGKVTFRACSYS